MRFLNLSNVEIKFYNWKLKWSSYIATEIFFIIREVELFGKKKWIVATFDSKDKCFVIYIASLAISHKIYLFWKAQIVLLKSDKTSSTILSKYFDLTDVFFLKLVVKILKHSEIKNYDINFIYNKQSPYESIYSLSRWNWRPLKLISKLT